MTTETKTETVNKNVRFFDVTAAAIALLVLADMETVDQALEGEGIVATDGAEDADKATAYLKSQGIATQGHFAAIVINFTHGEGKALEPQQLTEAVKAAFPNANVEKRHGPHYLSHARKGRLKGLREDLKPIPHARRKAKAKKDQEADLDLAENAPAITVALLLEENTPELLVEMAKGLGIKATAKWKTETVAAKIAEMMNPANDAEESEAA